MKQPEPARRWRSRSSRPDRMSEAGGYRPGTPGLVVVGASLAGLRAVEAARREGYDGTITLIGSEPHLPYDRPPLSKHYLVDESAEPVHYVSESRLREELDVDLHLGTTATALDSAERTIQASNGSFEYRAAIIATGSRPRSPFGAGLPAGVHEVRTLDHAQALRRSLCVAQKVVVVGGGFIGAEVASAARALGAAVTVVEGADVPLARAFGAHVGGLLSRLHEEHGVRLMCNSQVEEFLGRDRVEGVRLAGGRTLEADAVVLGVGAAPATDWLRGSAVELAPNDGSVICDGFLATAAPGVYAAGDVVTWPNALLDETTRLENWTNAADQGTRAAINALFPEKRSIHQTVPYFWSDWHGQRIQFVGTTRAAEVRVVAQDPQAGTAVALYGREGRLVGAATLNRPRKIMKLRRLITLRGTYDDAVHLVRETERVRKETPTGGDPGRLP